MFDEDEAYYLYAPVTDEENALYEKFGINNRDFLRINEAGLINLGERITNKLTAYDYDFCGFQNDNLVLVIQANLGKSCELDYKSYTFSAVGLQILELMNPDMNDDFFIALARIIKSNFKTEPVKTMLFKIEDIENAENLAAVDFGKDILK